jgi:lipoprotein-anchoring transpeptidase ErfK/SrfK
MKKLLLITILAIFFAPNVVLAVDSDGDGLSDKREQYFQTNPNDPDTDGDGFNDKIEIKHGYSPHEGGGTRIYEHDYDTDGLNDWVEQWFGSEIGVVDSNNDGMSDFASLMSGRHPVDTSQKFERKILVDKSTQHVFVIVDGIRITGYPVSTGLPSMPTPNGEFEIKRKLDTALYSGPGYHYPGVKWNMEFKDRYFLHSTYWHNNFGEKPMSHGCVNMRKKDAKELYKYFDKGATVEIVGKTPR